MRSLSNLISLHGAFDMQQTPDSSGSGMITSKKPLYIAGGILAALLIAGGIAVVVKNRKAK